MMEIIGRLFMYANLLLMAGSLPQIIAVYHNRKILRGYHYTGSLLMFLGLLIIYTAYYLLEAYPAILIGIPQLLYWLAVILTLTWRRVSEKETPN